jgi:hypothetical protein
MLSELLLTYVKNNFDEGATSDELSAVKENIYTLLNNPDTKISLLESVILYKNVPYDFNWKEYLDLNEDLTHSIKSEYLAKENYELYGFNENRLYKKTQLRKVNAFIYCGGKCGGITIFNTFQKYKIRSIHCHSGAEFIKNYPGCGSLYDLIQRNSELHETVYIIDSYRLPIERKMSSFFQNMSVDYPDYGSKTMSELMAIFNDQYINNIDSTKNNEDYHPLDEMMEFIGIEGFTKFDVKKTYDVIRHNNLVFVKLRFSNINKWSGILSEITGRLMNLRSDNLSINKPYCDLYEKFKKEYRVPRSYLKTINDDKEFVKYNSPRERYDYVRYWTHRSTHA